MHVDTGANGNVTCMSNELHNVVSSTVLCQTAKLGDADKVEYMGKKFPSFISSDRTVDLEVSLPNTVEMPPHYRRRSLIIPALKGLARL